MVTAFWFAAAYLSQLPDQRQAVLVGTLVLSLAGLFAPLAVVAAFVWRKPRLRADIVSRLKWPSSARWPFLLAALLLVPLTLMAAQGLSLFFGYDPGQFKLRGGFTFSTGLMPVWVTLIGPAVIEELAWHSYGTDTLVRKMRVFSASMLFTLIWALWHVPLSFIDGYYQNEVVESGVLQTADPELPSLHGGIRACYELAVLSVRAEHSHPCDLPCFSEYVGGDLHD